jgi:hypothetical protein
MATYKPLQSIALTSATTSITFSGIDQNYTDLVLVASTTVATASGNLVMTFNGDTTSGLYSKTQIEGTGSTVTSGRTTGANNIGLDSNMGSDTINPSIHIVNLTNYSNTTGFKTILHRQSSFWSANPGTALRVGLWRNTNAITSITLTSTSINFNSGSTFDLYGIKSGAPQALGGDLVTTDGNYWYHTFRTTGSFNLIAQRPLTVDYLVIAGGGGGAAVSSGGNYGAPGGGAGGYRTSVGTSGRNSSAESPLTLSPNINYTVTVGAGGSGNAVGSNSVFGTITSLGGGAMVGGAPVNGGSGGGSFDFSPQNVPGAGTSNQGFGGGAGASATSPGGGGGAGGAGSTARQGGIGITSSISGSSVGRAGGGGGGFTSSTNATDGGGSGGISNSNNGSAGTANTGGGGGGAAASGTTMLGGAGGSGIVIVRYPV